MNNYTMKAAFSVVTTYTQVKSEYTQNSDIFNAVDNSLADRIDDCETEMRGSEKENSVKETKA